MTDKAKKEDNWQKSQTLKSSGTKQGEHKPTKVGRIALERQARQSNSGAIA